MELVKKYFKLIQATHHLQILNSALENNTFPIGMTRKVDKLTSFIKPAAPDQIILEKVKAHTNQWMRSNILTLKEHYTNLFGSTFDTLRPFQLEAFEKATRWAYNRFKRKLSPQTIDKVRDELLVTRGPPDVGTTKIRTAKFKIPVPPVQLNEDDWPLLPSAVPQQQQQQPMPQRVPRNKTTVNRLTQQPVKPDVGESSTAPQSSPVKRKRVNENGTGKSNENLSCNVSEVNSNYKKVKITPTEPKIEAPKQKYKQLTFVQPFSQSKVRRARSSPELTTETSLQSDVPQTISLLVTSSPKDEWRKSGERERVEEAYDVNDNIDWLESVFSISFEGEPLLNNELTTLSDLQEDFDRTAGGDREREATEDAEASRGEQMRIALSKKLNADDNDKSEFSTSTSGRPAPDIPGPCDRQSKSVLSNVNDILQTTVPQVVEAFAGSDGAQTVHLNQMPKGSKCKYKTKHLPMGRDPLQEPTRHINTNRKKDDWSIEVRKTNIILGDSNLSRISPFSSQSLQIDSFPGANMGHLTELLKKMKPNKDVAKVVLSVGILNCYGVNIQTTLKSCVNKLRRAAREAFPTASIYWAVLNLHDFLAPPQQQAITQLNDLIMARGLFLTEINQQYFRTTDDGIHWTNKTANAILLHWLDQLNL